MKVLLALDSFKGSCSSEVAGTKVAEGIRMAAPDVETRVHGIADGGEGSAQVLLHQTNGEWVPLDTLGPLSSMTARSGFARVPEKNATVVEMATSAGLHLMAGRPLEPLNATTYGVGECVKAALEYSPEATLFLCLGGSATTDGGVGMAQALGWKFLDATGNEIGLGGGELQKIEKIIKPEGLFLPPVCVLCDVNNPLLGSNGSAAIYGPQKGAREDDVKHLEEGLSNLHRVILRDLKVDVNHPGDGAAGGLAAGARAFLNGVLESGIEAIMNLSSIDEKLDEADWVITGEGRLDHQSLNGKVVDGIIARAKARNVNVGVIAGQIALSEREQSEAGITWSYPLMKQGEPLEESMAATAVRLIESGAAFIRQ